MVRIWRILIGTLLLALLASPADARRKRVAVVLSGGGAKGVAHIGALRVLEEAGIPIDCIVGTSMGSIIGGLYAIGYDSRRLDSLVRAQDWEFLLSDKVYRYDLPFTEKEYDDRYLLSVPFGRRGASQRQVGFVSGHNVYNLFTDLTVGYHDSLDFTELPIPFACVAADMVSRKEVVMTQGNLVRAMRASMAIPGAFTPVRVDSMVLVDGGVLNNFPVDVARAMGAEVVIGVDVQADLMDDKQLASVSKVLPQLINLLCMNKYQENLRAADLVIRPNVKGYSAASFSARAIDTLLVRGEAAAREKWDDLLALRRMIGAEEEADSRRAEYETRETFAVRRIYVRGVEGRERESVERRLRIKEGSEATLDDIHRAIAELYGTKAYAAVNYRLLGRSPYDLELTLRPRVANTLNVGFRFDSEVLAAILLNTTFRQGGSRGGQLSLTGRLSMNPYLRVEYSLENTFLRRFNLAYTFQYNDVDVFSRGRKINNVTYRYHAGDLGISNFYFRNFRFGVGLRYEFFDYNSLLFVNEGDVFDVRPEGFFSYYGTVQWETVDRRFYPTRGVVLRADYSLYTDNFATYDGGPPFSALAWNFAPVVPVTNRFSLLPSLYGRVLIGGNTAYSYLNCMGGAEFGRYRSHQLPFAGISNVEIFDNALLVARLRLRQRMGSKHYLFLTGNYALCDANFFDVFGEKGMWGASAGYSRDSRIGPVDFVFSFSDWSEELGFYFNFGFYF